MWIEYKDLNVLCKKLSEVFNDNPLDPSLELADILRDRGVVLTSAEINKAGMALLLILEESNGLQVKFKEVGIQIDCSPASKWNIRHIAIRAAAQVVGFLNEDFNIRKIKDVILKQFGEPLHRLLYLDLLNSPISFVAPDEKEGKDPKDLARALERLIASVNPIPEGERRGRRSSKKTGEIQCIPGVFEEAEGVMKIHFPMLRVALGYLSLLLALFQGSDGVIDHPLITKYFNPIPRIFYGFLRLCVETGLEKASQYLQKS